ncbi:MAG: hypothetical protein U9R48_05330 [Chloroflexota bacterium]|nr:hypothetical protein [Chloroflexota bacterium]
MTTWESLAHGASYLAFARRVMGRDTEFLSTVRRSTEQGSRLRQKYTLSLVKPLSVRRLEPLVVTRPPLRERRANDEELALASAAPSQWPQTVEGQTGPSEAIEMPSTEPLRVGPPRAADMRAAVQRARASAEARRKATQRQGAPTPFAVPRAEGEAQPGEVRPVRRRAQLVEEPDRQRSPAPEPTQPRAARPSPLIEEAETPLQRGDVPAEPEGLAEEVPVVERPGEMASEEVRTQEAETRPSGPPTLRPMQEPSPASIVRSERAATRGEEAPPASVAEGEEIVPEAVEAEAEVEELHEVSSEPTSQEVEESAVSHIARRRTSPEYEIAEPPLDAGMSAPAAVEAIPGTESEVPTGEPEVYTRLGATSYEGNLRSGEASPLAPRRAPSEPVEGRRSVPEALEAVSEEISRRAPLDEPEVTEEPGGPGRLVSPRVRRAGEEVPEGGVRAQETRLSTEMPAAGVDEVPISREAEERGASEDRPTIREEGRAEAETERAPGAEVVRRAPRAARPVTPPGHLVREGEEASSERIERSEERAPVSPESAVSRERGAMDVVEDASVDTEGPGLQDVPLEEALFGVSEILRRAHRPSREEGAGVETSFVLPSISFRPPEAGEESPGPVRRADGEQAPAEPTAEVESVEAEAPDLGEEEETEGVNLGKLADEVYRRIRDRLRVERERYGRRGRW